MLKRNSEVPRIFINLIIIFVLGLAPLLWFKTGYLIKSEDAGLPLNFDEWRAYTYAWFNQRATGTYPIDNFSALFFLFLPAILQRIGFSIFLAQKIHFIFWFLLPGLSLYYLLVAIFGNKHPHPLVTLCAVGFYMFNLYLEPIWLGFNIANLSAYVSLPLLMGFFVNGLRTKKFLKYVCLSGIIAPLLSGIGVNPPVACVVLVIFILWVFYNFIFFVLLKKEIALKQLLIFLIFVFLVITLANAFWIYPQGMRLLKAAQLEPLKTYKQSIEEGIRERSKFTNLLNVLRLQGAWTWYVEYEEPYVLYSELYHKNALFLILAVIPTICAFLSLFNLKRSIYAPFFIILAVLGFILSAGIHPPLSFIYKFFLKFIPGFWLIRSPWYKWSLLTILGLSIMLGVFTEGLIERFKSSFFASKIWPLLIFTSIIVYAYPIATGKMFATKEQRTYIPPNHIKLPQYVYKASEWLSQKKDFFRVMVLPSMYRRITDWGYAGYEPVISYFTRKPIITPVLEGTFGSPYRIPNMDNFLYKWLYINKTGRDEKEKQRNIKMQKSHMVASKILPLFNIGYLLYERDIRWDFYDRYEKPDFIRQKLAQQVGVSFAKSFGRWDFYLIENKMPHIYATRTATFLDGGIKALEPLSRTDFFRPNIIFKKTLAAKVINFLDEQGIFNNKVFYNRPAVSNKDYKNFCLLLSTENSHIFRKKEVRDKNLEKQLEISFVSGTFFKTKDKTKERYWIKGAKVPLKIKIVNKSKENKQTNLKFSCYSFGKKRGLYIYLDGKLIQKNILEVNKKNEIRILNLELEPQENILEFVTTQESMPYGGQKRGISIEDDFAFYTYEFNALVKIPDKGSFFVNLYPYSIFDIKYLLPLKEININEKTYTLKFNKRGIEYKINKPLNFKKGINQIKFLQAKNENYYLLIASRLPETDAELIKLKVINENPVFYKIKIESQKTDSFLLIFNESFDEGWRAYYLEPSGKYKEITTHFPINGYANGYYLNLQGKNRQPITIVLKYIYQNQFWVGLIVASLVFSGCGFISIFIYFSKNSKIKQ